PDRGRYGWRRNTDPPDQPRANHRHRIAELLDRHGADAWADDAGGTTDDVPTPTVALSEIEHRQALRLIDHVTHSATGLDVAWLDVA
ncbi:MAG: hypothetical protein JHC79_22120, partial [Williamsia sp.]|nr:hypothetical protein [Williamsia sp.]